MEYNFTYREKDKGWQVILSYKDIQGKWKQRSKQGFAKQKQAKAYSEIMLENIKEEERLSTPAEFKGITLGEFYEIYLADRSSLSANSIYIIQSAIVKFEDIIDTPMTEIDFFKLAPIINKMKSENAYSTQLTYVRKMKVIFDYAITPYHIISKNPFNDVQLQKPVQEHKVKAITQNQLEDFLKKLKKRHYNYYMIALIAATTGLRISEVLGLTWADIDFKDMSLSVNKQWTYIAIKQHGFKAPKTKNSYRTVPIQRNLASELIKYKKISPMQINGRIFSYQNTQNVSSKSAIIFRTIGYDISMHSLRHTYATILLLNGIDVQTVAALLGDTVKVVVTTYIHYTEDMRQNAKERLQNIF